MHRGSGEPLVLVHGIGDSLRTWSRVFDRLAEERDCWAVDLPGFGRSAPIADPTVENLAGAVAAFMRGQGHETFHVAGNSLGGGVALVLGRQGVARSVCGLSPIGFKRGWERDYARVTLRGTRIMTRALAPIAHRITGPALARRVLAAQMVARGDRYSPAELAGTIVDTGTAPGFEATLQQTTGWTCPPGDLPCPTTIAWGDKDRLLLYRPQSARAREALPGARHVTLHGCGHLPTWDDPEHVARVILETSDLSR